MDYRFLSSIRVQRLTLAAALAIAVPATAQTTPVPIDAGHSYATLWMGRQTEVAPMVNVGVAQVGGAVRLASPDPAAGTLEFNLVPGGEGAELLAPDGTLRTGVIARIVRYTSMSFHTTSSRVRRDGRLEFTGPLTLTHVTRESIPTAWNGANSFPSYTDPETSQATRTVRFTLVSPRVDGLAAYVQKDSDIVVTATITDSEFPELPGVVLDSFWPTVAEDEVCAQVGSPTASRDYSGTLCTGKAISTTAALQRAQTSGVDYSGLRKHDAPTRGPVTILLHLKLPPAAPPAR